MAAGDDVGEQLTQGIDVRGFRNVDDAATFLFRCHEPPGTNSLADVGQPVVFESGFEETDPEIGDVRFRERAVQKENICRFDVAMNDPDGVSLLDSANDADEDLER